MPTADALHEAFDPADADWTRVSGSLATMRRTVLGAVGLVILSLVAVP